MLPRDDVCTCATIAANPNLFSVSNYDEISKFSWLTKTLIIFGQNWLAPY